MFVGRGDDDLEENEKDLRCEGVVGGAVGGVFGDGQRSDGRILYTWCWERYADSGKSG